MSRSFILLFLIVSIGLILRFYNLGSIPVGFHRDEAILGYNTYSLLLTARDMTGDFLPIHLTSVLYSPAGYAYVSIPFVALFGLTEFAVRFASALFGTATIILVYFLVKELFGKRGTVLGLLSAFFLAISPWHINLSRVATENVLVVFFITLGVLLYLQWVRKERMWLLVLSFFAFGITLALYQAPRAFLPLFLPVLFLFFHPKNIKKHIFVPALLFVVTIVLPVVMVVFSSDLSERLRQLSIFQNPQTKLILEEQIREDEGHNVNETRFFHNKIMNYSFTILNNYFNHFSYNFLFTDSGFPDRYRVPQMGLLYLFELPLLLIGLWMLSVSDKKRAGFLTMWILIVPIGTAFTFDDVPNMQRTLIIFPALSIIVAYGFLSVWNFFARQKFGMLARVVMVLLILHAISYYLHQYYVHQVNHRPWFRQEGYQELVAQVKKMQASYKKVVVTHADSSPAIFFLFYEKYDPTLLQKQFLSHPTEFAGRVPFKNYEFPEDPCPLHVLPTTAGENSLPELSGEKDVLYINGGNCKELDERVKVLSEIKRSDGTVVFTLQTVAK